MEHDLVWKGAGGQLAQEVSRVYEYPTDLHGDESPRSSDQQPIRFSTLYTHGDGSTIENVEMVDGLADIASYIEITHVRKAYCDYLHFVTAMECDDGVDDKTRQVSFEQLEKYRLGYYAACLQWYMYMCVGWALNTLSLKYVSEKHRSLKVYLHTLKFIST